MALNVGDREIRPLTADEVMEMVRVGILSEDEPVELLDGVLTRVSPKSPEHGAVLARLLRWIDPAGNADRFDVLVEQPLAVPDATALPEPDLLVVPADPTRRRHPASAPLVVEVAVTSLAIDLGRKAELYAAADVPEYWVVDVPARGVHVLGRPSEHGYRHRTFAAEPTRLRPAGLPVGDLDLAVLFAEL